MITPPYEEIIVSLVRRVLLINSPRGYSATPTSRRMVKHAWMVKHEVEQLIKLIVGKLRHFRAGGCELRLPPIWPCVAF